MSDLRCTVFVYECKHKCVVLPFLGTAAPDATFCRKCEDAMPHVATLDPAAFIQAHYKAVRRYWK